MDRFKLNSPEQGEAGIREAIEATKAGDVRRAVKALTKLAGVKLKMASAILTAMFPRLYTVCDFRASHALGVKDSGGLRFYVAYLPAAGKRTSTPCTSSTTARTRKTEDGTVLTASRCTGSRRPAAADSTK
jgi:hypothetical protein